ncbi:MAG: hypothetical protein J7K88_05755 [Candidatus Fermentibacteraceae bacterium]|nr:hypothetical protein [Candidatus Fermentibacteraceae bacterium]
MAILAEADAGMLVTKVCCKRTEPLVVSIFLLLEGDFQSLTDKLSSERIVDSRTLQCYFHSHGLGAIPPRSNRHENVRKISQTTQDYILSVYYQ